MLDRSLVGACSFQPLGVLGVEAPDNGEAICGGSGTNCRDVRSWHERCCTNDAKGCWPRSAEVIPAREMLYWVMPEDLHAPAIALAMFELSARWFGPSEARVLRFETAP